MTAPRLDDTDDRVTGWCRQPDGCTDPDCACLALCRAAPRRPTT